MEISRDLLTALECLRNQLLGQRNFYGLGRHYVAWPYTPCMLWKKHSGFCEEQWSGVNALSWLQCDLILKDNNLRPHRENLVDDFLEGEYIHRMDSDESNLQTLEYSTFLRCFDAYICNSQIPPRSIPRSILAQQRCCWATDTRCHRNS